MLASVSTADMMKAVGSALDASYKGKKWLKWFTTNAKAIIAELDGKSTAGAVRACVFGRIVLESLSWLVLIYAVATAVFTYRAWLPP